MPLFLPNERIQAESVAQLVLANPFLPERVEAEKKLLGRSRGVDGVIWNRSPWPSTEDSPLPRLTDIANRLACDVRHRILGGTRGTAIEFQLYGNVVLYVLYYRCHAALEEVIRDAKVGRPRRKLAQAYESLSADVQHFFGPGAAAGQPVPDPAHLLACFFQVCRAFDQIFASIVGASMPAAKLRAAIWQSIFTHDMRRYRRVLFDRTGDFTTLIVGPSGTGKELVARAIGASRFIPFDNVKKQFAEDFHDSFFPLNLQALSATLIESELFGHRRGAFTGAVEDRPGWLQTCPPLGTVFLDEIGELDGAIQVKLLRVLQMRTFQRLGDTRTIEFRGKIIAATHRDLAAEMRLGRFRHDFYYRLCSDVIVTPSLAEQLAGSFDELQTLVHFIARQLLGDEADDLTEQVLACIRRRLGKDYAWPGNFRELEQCVRNVLIRGDYQPVLEHSAVATDDAASAFAQGAWSADRMLSHYCKRVYDLTGTYEAAAQRLGLDRRTVKSQIHHGGID